jgi:hypothetical protein
MDSSSSIDGSGVSPGPIARGRRELSTRLPRKSALYCGGSTELSVTVPLDIARMLCVSDIFSTGPAFAAR